MELLVMLNGTTTNPWHRYGLTHNPFPQMGGASLALQKLGGDPIPNTAYIRQMLVGFSAEFIDLCCEQFVPGKLVKFTVHFPGD